MKEWAAIIAALAALGMSTAQALSSDRLKIEQRVTKVEEQAASNQEALKQIRDDVKEIRQFLLGRK